MKKIMKKIIVASLVLVFLFIGSRSVFAASSSHCVISSFDVDDSSINEGDSVVLTWHTRYCDSIYISNVGSVSSSGSRRVYPSYTRTYTINATGDYGSDSDSVKVYVDNNVNNNYNITPTVFTYTPTNTTSTNATLSGFANGNGALINSWIEFPCYGTKYGNKYDQSSSSISTTLNSLSLNTTYNYCMVAQNVNNYQMVRGNIVSFTTVEKTYTPPVYVNNNIVTAVTTKSDTTPKPIAIQSTTVAGKESSIKLSISNKYEAMGKGDLIDYVVTYKNIGKIKLTKPMVQVILPTNVTLVNSSRGTYSIDTHTLFAMIEDLDGGQEGVIYLQGKVDSMPKDNSQITTNAILVYTNLKGAQENAMAYVINTPKLGVVSADNLLGGSAFSSGFQSISLLGLLLIILIIMVLILISRFVYKRNSSEINNHTATH